MGYDKVQPTKIAYVDGRPQTLHLRKARLILNDHEPAPILPEIDAAIRKRFEILLTPNQHQTL